MSANNLPTTENLIYTVKEMAAAIQHSEDFVGDMKKGGFRFPATKSQAVEFIREHGPVRRFRHHRRTRMELYGHSPRPSCENKSTEPKREK